MQTGVYNYYVLKGKISKNRPKKGCSTVSKETIIKYKGEPDVRLKHCEPELKKKKV